MSAADNKMTYLVKFCYAVAFVVASCIPYANCQADENEFPERARYYMVKWISSDDLLSKMKSVEIVDVRSQYEFETLHITGARNIVLGTPGFVMKVKALRSESKKPIVFYCNGQTCKKSYEAAIEAQNAGVGDVYAYDAGILSWVRKFPDLSELFGKSPVPQSALISKEKLKAHMLAPDAFGKRVGDKNSIVLDLRDDFQQDGVALFPLIQRTVKFDNKYIQPYVKKALDEDKTLMFFDATGHQVQWLQYYLEEQRVSSYYFMEGGAKKFYDNLKLSHETTGDRPR